MLSLIMMLLLLGLSLYSVMAQQTTGAETETFSTIALSNSYSYTLPTEPDNCHDMTVNSEGEYIFCRKRQRLSMREYYLRHPFVPSEIFKPLATVSSQTNIPQRVYPPQVLSSRAGGTVNIEVGSLLDTEANVTSCMSSQQSPQDCNYRSAMAYCQQYLTEPTKYCFVSLPAYGTLMMDPLLGDVTVTEVTGNLYLVSVVYVGKNGVRLE